MARLSDHLRHQQLKKYGNADALLRDAEKELNANLLLKIGELSLTPKFLFVYAHGFTRIIPLESVLWIYDLQNMKYSLKEKREKMVWTLRIITIAGDSFHLKFTKKQEMDELMKVLIDRYPNFFYGWSEDHDHMVHYILEENRKELAESRKKKK